MSEAAFFDLDKTVIARSSALAFGKQFYANGLINRRAMLKGSYAQLVYLLGGADETQMARLRDDLARTVAGWDVEQVNSIVAEALYELIDPLVYDEAAALIESHHAAGRDVVIVSSSGEDVVGPIAEMIGADQVIATRMVRAEGRYTGEVAFYAAGPAKAEAMRELADRMGYDLAVSYAYSDSVTDLPMLEAVGHPHAVNPDRGLRREAQARGWPVLTFRRTVPLRKRFRRFTPPSRPMVVGGAAVALAAAGIAWRARATSRETAARLSVRPRDVTGRSRIRG